MSNRKLTNADWLSIVGIVFYALFTCIGFLFTKQLTMSVAWTLGYVAVVIGLLLILKRLKKIEDNIRFFRVVEYVTLLVVAVLMLFLFNRPMERYFNMSGAKETLKASANADMEAYIKVFDVYEGQEGDAIESTKISLGKVVGKSKNYIGSDLKEYMTSHFNKAEYMKSDEVISYSERLQQKYLSLNGEGIPEATWIEGDYMTFKTETLERIEKIKTVIESWSPFTIPFTVVEYGYTSIPSLGREIGNELTRLSQSHNADGMPYKFIIKGNSSAGYEVESALEYSYSLPNSYKEAFLRSLDTSSFALWPFIWSLLIDVLILFSYLMGYRSTKVEIMRQSGNCNIPGTRL